MCSNEIIPENYAFIINRFANAWFVLSDKFNLSTTPKMHIILDHIEEYYSENNISLVKTSDQLIENMHQYTHKRMLHSNYYVKHVENPQNGKQLFKCILHLNSYNLSCVEIL